jgi:hypothetical protein
MSRPNTRRLVWIVAVMAVVTAGALVTWSAATTTSSTDSRPVRASTETRPPAVSMERLAEPPAPAPVVPPVPAQVLVSAAESVAAPGMTLGVAVLDIDTGELVVGRGGTRQFMAASLSKLIVAVDVLDRHRADGRSVDPADLDLITRALSGSDDNAMNVLWGKHDGASAVSRVADRLALTASLASESTNMWGDTVVTAADLVKLYRHVLRDMAPPDSAVIVDALTAAAAAATDGFAQHYGLLHQGASKQHYAKQAWVPYEPAGYLLHSAGVAHDERTGHTYAIALLSIQPYTRDHVARERLSTVAAAAMATLAIG